MSFYRVGWLVVNKKRPDRLETPKMSERTWKLIESCWKPDASERLNMEQIVLSMASQIRPSLSEYRSVNTQAPRSRNTLASPLSSLLGTLSEVHISRSLMHRR